MAKEITYRLAFDSDINRINEFYNIIYKKQRTHEQFVWEYNSAPAGKAIYIIAEEDGAIVGTQCAIPYFVINKNNEEVLTAKSEDTLVSPKHRGKKIFENMYSLLIEECSSNKINFIWGFTYADKPFKKIGFDIPFKSSMGLIALSPIKAANYFYSITPIKNFNSYCKILFLSFYSFIKYSLPVFKKKLHLSTDDENVDFNNINFNYISQSELFGLKLDKPFLNYRITNNPYNSNYKTINYREEGIIKASMIYNITNENVGFIIHLYFSDNLNDEKKFAFISQTIKQTNLKNAIVIRFWGFEHNSQNKSEIYILRKSQFIFLKRGISFVGLKLNKKFE